MLYGPLGRQNIAKMTFLVSLAMKQYNFGGKTILIYKLIYLVGKLTYLPQADTYHGMVPTEKVIHFTHFTITSIDEVHTSALIKQLFWSQKY